MLGLSTSSNLVDPPDDDAVGILDIDRTMKLLASIGYPALRLLLALVVVWISSSVSS